MQRKELMAKLFRSVSVRGFVLTMHSTRICVCVSVSKRGKTIQGHTEWNDFSLALSCSLCREGNRSREIDVDTINRADESNDGGRFCTDLYVHERAKTRHKLLS